MNDVAARVTTRVLTGGACVPVGVDTELSGPGAPAVPDGLRRTDGTSVFRVAKAQLFTTRAVLDAERRIVTAAGRTDGKRATDSGCRVGDAGMVRQHRRPHPEHRAGADGRGRSPPAAGGCTWRWRRPAPGRPP